MDKLAEKMNMDPAQLRLLNGAKEGDDTPTQVFAHPISSTGSI